MCVTWFDWLEKVTFEHKFERGKAIHHMEPGTKEGRKNGLCPGRKAGMFLARLAGMFLAHLGNNKGDPCGLSEARGSWWERSSETDLIKEHAVGQG